jgi:glutaredoxin 3
MLLAEGWRRMVVVHPAHFFPPAPCLFRHRTRVFIPAHMPKVVIYSTPYCPYCLMAKRLLSKKGVAYEDIDVSGNWELRDKLVEMSGGRMTVPQIWIGDTHVGGYDDLSALEREGKLDALLAA